MVREGVRSEWRVPLVPLYRWGLTYLWDRWDRWGPLDRWGQAYF